LNQKNGKNLLNNKKLRFTIVDAAVILCLIAAVYLFVAKAGDVLDYKWAWNKIVPYFFYFDRASGRLVPNVLATGFGVTVKLSLWSTLLGLMLGVVSGIAGARGSLEQRFISRVYVETARNIPSLVLVIIFYYFVSSQFLDALHLDTWLRTASGNTRKIFSLLFAGPDRINSFVSAVAALGIYEGAYVSEIIRGGIISIPEGQWEAALSVGLSRRRTFVLIILPQTFRRVAFPLAGQFISTIKDSSIVSVISIQELTFQGMELMSATFLTFEIWITVTGLYFILTFSLSRAVAFLENKYRLRY